MSKNNTCGNCENLKITSLMRGQMYLASCSLDDLVVPHQWGGELITLWRVPLECKKEGMIKSKKQAPKSDWITINVKDK